MLETQKNKALFEMEPIPKAVARMAVPTILGQLIVLIYNLADTFFIGRTDNPYMVAAASLILPVFNMALPIAAVAGVGGGALVSRLLGEKRETEAKKVYSFSVWSSLLTAASFSLLIFLFMTPLLRLLGAGTETEAFARSYAIWVIVFGAVPTVMTNVFSNFVRSIGESAKAGIGIFLGGAINIALDPLFMFVLLPDGQEIIGAGISTFLSNCISCGYFIILMKQLKKTSPLAMMNPGTRPEKDSLKRILSVGIPSAVATLLFDLDYIVIDKLMSGYSDTALAAIGIVLKAERFPLNIGVGICQGMVPIVAYNYASGNRKRMKEVSRFSLILGIVCGVISIVLYELFAPSIMGFFMKEPITVSLGTGFLRIRSLATIFMFMSFYHIHLFNGYGRGKEALILGITRWAIFNIPMLFLLNSLFGMYGIVWSQLAADVLTVLLSFAVHHRFMKKERIGFV